MVLRKGEQEGNILQIYARTVRLHISYMRGSDLRIYAAACVYLGSTHLQVLTQVQILLLYHQTTKHDLM